MLEDPSQGKHNAKVRRRPVGSTDFGGVSPVMSKFETQDVMVPEAGRPEQESIRPQNLAVPRLSVPAPQQRSTGRRSPRQEISRRSPDHFQYPAAAQPIPRQNPPTARLANRNSIQFPANGFYYETTKFRPLNPNTSSASFSRRRPLSYMSTSPKGGLDWRQGGPAPTSTPSARKPVSEPPSAGSVATGMPVFGSRRPVATGPEGDHQWRYHILKTAGPATPDLVLTTNPDAEHVRSRVAPAYCVSVMVQGAPTSQGQLGFTMTVIDPRKHMCAVAVTRLFAAATEEELYEVVVYDNKPEARGRGGEFAEFDFGQSRNSGSTGVVTDDEDELSGEEMVRLTRQIMSIQGQVPVVAGRREAWRSLLRARPGTEDPSKLMAHGRKPAGRQFELQDDRGRRWVVGNRAEGSDGNSSGGDSDEGDENDDDHTRHMPWSAVSRKKHSSPQHAVHCFIPGDSGPESDLQMATLDRVKPSKSQSHLYFDDNERDDTAGSAAATNYGTLTMHAHLKKRPGMWAVAAALTLAVSYGQGLDVRESSVGDKLRRFGRKYKEGRKQVYYGHWHTQSLG